MIVTSLARAQKMASASRRHRRLLGLGRWLTPGLGVKRWVAILLLGTALIGLGLSGWFVAWAGEGSALRVRLPSPIAASALVLVGLAAVLFATARISRSVLAPYVRPGQPVVQVLSEHRRRNKGPRVVAIGGGTGLSVLLRGLKTYTTNITAIVTVADDGGSSGRLRRSLGVPPPGDFRSCLAALADDESLTTRLFQYRFGAAEGLDGHAFGNLFLIAMAGVTGSFERALVESSQVLLTRGRVVPSTLQDVVLMADVAAVPAHAGDGGRRLNRVAGESNIPAAKGAIRRVFLQPENPPAYPEAVQAILGADLIVAGPGSLYTSVIPNLLVPDIAQALAASRAKRVYVCNVATQPGETDGYSVQDHVAAVERHAGAGIFPIVLANRQQTGRLLPRLDWVRLDLPLNGGHEWIVADLIDPDAPWRHSIDKLAGTLQRLGEGQS